MLFPQKEHNTEALQTNQVGVSTLCTGRLQRRTAAVICIHLQVPNSLPDVGTGRSEATSVCSTPVSSLHTLHLLAWLWAPPLYMSIYIVNKAPELLKRSSYLLSSSLLSFFSLDLNSHCLLSLLLSSASRYYFFLWLPPSFCSLCLTVSSSSLFLFLTVFLYIYLYYTPVQETPVASVCTSALL